MEIQLNMYLELGLLQAGTNGYLYLWLGIDDCITETDLSGL